MRLEVEDEHLRVELLAARGSRAAVGAAPALGAVVEVKEVFPGELGDPPYAEALRVFQIQPGKLALGGQGAEEDVERGGHDVEVLGVREPHQKARRMKAWDHQES